MVGVLPTESNVPRSSETCPSLDGEFLPGPGVSRAITRVVAVSERGRGRERMGGHFIIVMCVLFPAASAVLHSAQGKGGEGDRFICCVPPPFFLRFSFPQPRARGKEKQ